MVLLVLLEMILALYLSIALNRLFGYDLRHNEHLFLNYMSVINNSPSLKHEVHFIRFAFQYIIIFCQDQSLLF